MSDTHVVDHGGDGRSVVLLHGLGGSHAGWTLAGPAIASGARVRAVDLPGFGLSPPRRSASVSASAKALVSLLEREEIGPSVVAGNSMGGIVALTAADRRPDLVQGIVLVNPGLPRNKHVPLDDEVAAMFRPVMTMVGVGLVRDRWDRLGAEGAVEETLRLCCVAPSSVPEEISSAMIEVRRDTFATNGSAKAYAQAAWSVGWVLSRRRAFYRLIRRIDVPVLLVHGAEDRLVPFDSAVQAVRRRPDWEFQELRGIGHLPQLECPDRLASLVLDWLGRLEGGAASGLLRGSWLGQPHA